MVCMMSKLYDETTPCKRFYNIIAELELRKENDINSFGNFMDIAQEIMSAAPSLKLLIADVSSLVLLGKFEEALSRCKILIEAENNILKSLHQETIH